MNNATESQAMRNVERMMHRKKLMRIVIITGIVLLAIVLFMILCTPNSSAWTSDMKIIDAATAYKNCPVIEITENEREYIAAALEYCTTLEINSITGAYKYLDGSDMQPILDATDITATSTGGIYDINTNVITLTYYDVFYRYELSVIKGEGRVTKTVSMPNSGDIGLFQRYHTYLNTENEHFEKHTSHIDLLETIKMNLPIKSRA